MGGVKHLSIGIIVNATLIASADEHNVIVESHISRESLLRQSCRGLQLAARFLNHDVCHVRTKVLISSTR